MGPVRPVEERHAVDVVVVNNDQLLISEHILSGGGIAMSRAAKSAVDQVRLVLLEDT